MTKNTIAKKHSKLKIICGIILCIIPHISHSQKKNHENYIKKFQDYTKQSYYQRNANNITVSDSIKFPEKKNTIEVINQLLPKTKEITKNKGYGIDTINWQQGKIKARIFFPRIFTKKIILLGNIVRLDSYGSISIEITETKLNIRCTVNKLLINVPINVHKEGSITDGYPFSEKIYPMSSKKEQAQSIVYLIDLMHKAIKDITQQIQI